MGMAVWRSIRGEGEASRGRADAGGTSEADADAHAASPTPIEGERGCWEEVTGGAGGLV